MHISRNLSILVAGGAMAAGLTLAAGVVSASTVPGDSAAAVITPGEPPSDPTTAEFCDTLIQIEAVSAAAEEVPDPAVLEPLFETLAADAPAEITDTVATIIDLAQSGADDYTEPYGQLVAWLPTGCGFGTLTFTATEHAYGGLPSEIPAGRYAVDLENIGEEFHLAFLVRVNDDVTATVEELLALPEEEIGTHVTELGAAFADPGGVGNGIFDLSEPGRYLIVCPLPVGMTPEVMASGSFPEGAASHYSQGMYQEIIVD